MGETRHLPAALTFLLAARRSELAALQHLSKTCELVMLISRLIHALQRERGYSNIYLGVTLPHVSDILADYSQEALLLQRQVLDWLQLLQQEPGENGRLLDRIAYAVYGLETLPTLRRRIRERALDAAAASLSFTRLIGALLSVIFEVADKASEPDLTRALVALFNFIQGKELAGQERALGVLALAEGFFDDARLCQLENLIEGQQRCFEAFFQQTNETYQVLWHDLISRDAPIKQLRELARRTSPAHTVAPVLAESWFDVFTQRIDELRHIEAKLEEALQQQCQGQIQRASKVLENHRVLCKQLAQGAEYARFPAWFSVQEHLLGVVEASGGNNESELLNLLQVQNQRLQQLDDELRQARRSLDERRRIEQAKKILMKQQGLTESEAHEQLRRLAMNSGGRLLDVAEQVLLVCRSI